MCKLRAILSGALLVCFVSTPGAAMPFSARTVMNSERSVENARLICDELESTSAL